MSAREIDGPSFEEIAETFQLLDDWEARYGYVIELGQGLSGVDDALKTAATKVEGCASQVWLVTELVDSEDGSRRLYFEGDSDAHIVRGLIAVLRALLSGNRVSEIAAADPVGELGKIGLGAQLSAQRSNGLRAMIARLQGIAKAAA